MFQPSIEEEKKTDEPPPPVSGGLIFGGRFQNGISSQIKSLFQESLQDSDSDEETHSTIGRVYIHLDKASLEYLPGEAITGNVIVRIFEGQSISATEITIRFFGIIETKWDTDNGTTCEGHDTLFDILERVKGDGEKPFIIPSGDQEYKFSIRVPIKTLPLPSDFEEVQVLYQLQANVRRPQWSKNDPKSEKIPVSIATISDLNHIPVAREPVNLEHVMKFATCFCFRKRSIVMRVFAPKSGYIPGEKVEFFVEITNNSRKMMHNLTAELLQIWTMTGYSKETHDYKKKDSVNLLQSESGGRVGPGQGKIWSAVFTIPPTVPPSTVKGSSGNWKLFYLKYAIKVSSLVEMICGIRTEFGLKFHVYIGTVPLRPSSSASQAPGQNETPRYDETGGLA